MSLREYLLLAFSSLFVIVDPIALIPSFLALTEHAGPHRRERTAGIACLAAAIVLMGFAAAGEAVFHVLGITMPAFQIAGSILLLIVALDMLRARPTAVRETPAETSEAAAQDDVAFSPLAVPMLAGPGACSAVLLLHTRAADELQRWLLYPVIAVVCLVAWGILRLSARHAMRISPTAMRVGTRLMGLLLAAVAVQFFLDGVRDSGVMHR